MNNLLIFLLPFVFTSFISITFGQIISQSVTTTFDEYVQSNNANNNNRRTIGGSYLTFSEIIRQKTNGNQVQQCPCVRPPGVNRCISYDSRFQGASIEEAILTFVDTSMDPRIYDDRIGGPIGSRSLLCSTEECRQCAAILAIRLRQIGLLQSSPTFSFPIPNLNQIQPQLCPRLRLSRTIPNLQPPPIVPSFVTQMVSAGLARIPPRDTTPRTAFGAAVAAAIRQARSIRGRPFFDVIARIRNQRLQNAVGNRRNQQNQGNGNGGGGSRGISRPQQPQQQQQNPRPQGQFPPTFPSPQPRPQQPSTPNNFPNRIFPQPGQQRPQPNQPQTFPINQRPPPQNQQPPFQQVPIQFPQPPQQQPPQQQPIFQNPIIQLPGQQQPPPFIQQPIFQQPGIGQQPVFQPPVQQQPIFQQPPSFPVSQNPQSPNGQFPQGNNGIFSPQGPFANIQQPIGSALSGLAQQGALQGFHQAISAIPGLGGGGGAGQGGGIGAGGGGGGGGVGAGGQGQLPGPVGFPFGRKKRAADDGILGDRFVISCVERGDTENEASDYLNLCTACWTWRQLPPDYFPRLINELVCNENDYCLSGWGSCQQRYRNVDVLRRGPNGAWQPTSISVATCCDCKVKAGTEVHALVIGQNKV